MKKVFISQPMKDKTDEEIKKERQEIIDAIVDEYGKDIEIIDNYLEGAPAAPNLAWFLGKSIELLSTADGAFFARGWKDARGCKIEHEVAEEYGIDILCD